MYVQVNREILPNIPEPMRSEILTKIVTRYGPIESLDGLSLMTLINFELNLISLKSVGIESEELPTKEDIHKALRGPKSEDQKKAEIDQILCEHITDEINVKLEDFSKEELIAIIRGTDEDLSRALKLLRGEK